MAESADVPVPLGDLLENRAWVRALARSLTSNRADADDLEQDALVAAIARPPEAGRPLRPWLARVAANLERKRLRGQGRRRDREQRWFQAEAQATPDALFERVSIQRDVVDAVMELAEPYRTTLLLRYYEGLSTAEIARRQGAPEATVRQRTKRGLARLRERLSSRYGGQGPMRARLLLVLPAHAARLGVLGVLLMKKVVLGVALVLTAVGLWIAGARLVGGPDPRPNASGAEVVLAEPSGGEALGVGGRAATSRAELDAVRVAAGGEAEPRAAASESGSLVVRVERTGRPVVGEVVLVRHEGQPDGMVRHLAERTDGSGEARFARLPAGELRIGSVRSDDRRDVSMSIELGAEVRATLAIVPGVRIRGRVTTPSGVGLAGAEVWITPPYDRMRGHPLCTTDERGAFAIEDVQPFGHNWIGARAAGRAQSPWHYIEGHPGSEVELEIVLARPGTSVAGRVSDRHGAAVSGATVLLGTQSADWATSEVGGPPDRVTTSQDGAFRFESVPSGTLPLLVRAPGFGLYRDALEVAGHPRDDERIVLVAAARVSGVVTDPAGRVVPGADVRVDQLGEFGALSTRSGADGRFVLDGLGDGTYELVASKPWIGAARATLESLGGRELEWHPVLALAPAIFGTVHAPDGEPLGDMRVSTWVPVGGEPVQFSTRTDSDGRFFFGDLRDKWHRVWVAVEGTEFLSVGGLGARPSLEPLEVRLERQADVSGTLVGRVVGPAGRVVPSAEVYASHLEREDFEQYERVDLETGEFEFRFPAGRLQLFVGADEHPWIDLGERSLGVGERLDLGPLALVEPSFVTGSISGVAGGDLDSVSLHWFDEHGDALGGGRRDGYQFRSVPLPPGFVRLVGRADHVEQLTATFELGPGEQQQRTLAFRPAGLLTVVLELPEGAARPEHVWGELWGDLGDGEERQLWSWDGPAPPAGSLALRVFARAGTWTFRGGVDTKLGVQATVSVPHHGAGAEEVQLLLER